MTSAPCQQWPYCGSDWPRGCVECGAPHCTAPRLCVISCRKPSGHQPQRAPPGAAAPSRLNRTEVSPPRLCTFLAPCCSPDAPMIVSPSPYSCVPPDRPSASTTALRGPPGRRARAARRRRSRRSCPDRPSAGRAAARPGCRRTGRRSSCPCRSAGPSCRRPGPTGSAGRSRRWPGCASFQPGEAVRAVRGVGVHDLELRLRDRRRGVRGVVGRRSRCRTTSSAGRRRCRRSARWRSRRPRRG